MFRQFGWLALQAGAFLAVVSHYDAATGPQLGAYVVAGAILAWLVTLVPIAILEGSRDLARLIHRKRQGRSLALDEAERQLRRDLLSTARPRRRAREL